MKLEKYSIGIGDRFGMQSQAQLQALILARSQGIAVVPVWNKSFREHNIINTTPAHTRNKADQAVSALKWPHSYYVDADHINLHNVESFIHVSNYFTIDVAEYIGRPAGNDEINGFIEQNQQYIGKIDIPGIDSTLSITANLLKVIAGKYLFAIEEAGKIYRHILSAKGQDSFITEISMDECDTPQTPLELLIILAALAREKIQAQTIAPRFCGDFLKGIDYRGRIKEFVKQFSEFLAVIAYAVKQFNLPVNLKLSVHSGSDKFSIYKPINLLLKEYNAGLHIKTAGTTWLEEVIGLAQSGGDGLRMVKEIYAQALPQYDALCQPYAQVIDIDRKALPAAERIACWSADDFLQALSHDPSNRNYDINLRQFFHVSYKIAACLGETYIAALEKHADIIGENVTNNIFKRHILPIFKFE